MSSELPDKEEIKKASISYAMDWGSKYSFSQPSPPVQPPPSQIMFTTHNSKLKLLTHPQSPPSPQCSSQPSSQPSTRGPSNHSPCSSRPSSSSARTSTSPATRSTLRVSQLLGQVSISCLQGAVRFRARASVRGLGISLVRGD